MRRDGITRTNPVFKIVFSLTFVAEYETPMKNYLKLNHVNNCMNSVTYFKCYLKKHESSHTISGIKNIERR